MCNKRGDNTKEGANKKAGTAPQLVGYEEDQERVGHRFQLVGSSRTERAPRWERVRLERIEDRRRAKDGGTGPAKSAAFKRGTRDILFQVFRRRVLLLLVHSSAIRYQYVVYNA